MTVSMNKFIFLSKAVLGYTNSLKQNIVDTSHNNQNKPYSLERIGLFGKSLFPVIEATGENCLYEGKNKGRGMSYKKSTQDWESFYQKLRIRDKLSSLFDMQSMFDTKLQYRGETCNYDGTVTAYIIDLYDLDDKEMSKVKDILRAHDIDPKVFYHPESKHAVIHINPKDDDKFFAMVDETKSFNEEKLFAPKIR